jgi:hypothetical protein
MTSWVVETALNSGFGSADEHDTSNAAAPNITR